MIIEIVPTDNGADVDVYVNGEWQHTFDVYVTAIESLKLDCCPFCVVATPLFVLLLKPESVKEPVREVIS